MKSGIGAGKKTNYASNKVTVQGTAGREGKSRSQNTAVGSGSRPGPGSFKIESSNPSGTQMIRPTNRSEGTGSKG